MDFILLPEPNLTTRLKETYHSLATLAKARAQGISANLKALKPRVTFGVLLLILFGTLSVAAMAALTLAVSTFLVDVVGMSPPAAWGTTALLFMALAVGSLLVFRRVLDPNEIAEEIVAAKAAVKVAESDFNNRVEALEQHVTNTVAEVQEKAMHAADEVKLVVHDMSPSTQVRRHPWPAVAAAVLVGGLFAINKRAA